MIGTLDIIDRLPYELKERLEADDYFSDIPVVVAEDGNIRAEIAKRQAVIQTKIDKRGVAVIVLQILADDDHPNLQFGPMTLRPAFQVVENLELNRDKNGTGKSARRVARRIRDVIKVAGMTGLVIDMKADKPCIEPLNLAKDLGDNVKAYQVNFRCIEQSLESLGQVAMPVFQPLAPQPQFAISCATPNAVVFYTTDDSYPRNGNPSAVEYAMGQPIAIPQGGVTVRACAYVPGKIASWVNRATIVAQ